MTNLSNDEKYYFNSTLLNALNLDTLKKYSIYEIYLECKNPKNNVISKEMRKIFPELDKEQWFVPYYKMRYLIKNHIIYPESNYNYIILNKYKNNLIDKIEIKL